LSEVEDAISALRGYLDALPAGSPPRRDRWVREQRLLPSLRAFAVRERDRARRRRALRRAAMAMTTAALGVAAVAVLLMVLPPGRDRGPKISVLDGELWLENGTERRTLSAGDASGIRISDAMASSGERAARVRLADSATLTLAPASRVAGVVATASGPNGVPRVEAIRLERGTAHLQVAKLAGLQRFHVMTADADVEVRGTEFDVELRPGSRPGTCVRVQDGLVLVAAGAHQTFVRPGETWGCPPDSSLGAMAPRSGRSAAASASDLRRQNALFGRALQAERGGRFGEAASIYRHLLAGAPDGPLAVQARANLAAVSGPR
jgi:ferric-dicitrate binding protein FerR (iron transport regulator)